MHVSLSPAALASLAAVFLLAAPNGAAAQVTEFIRGRVTGADTMPLADARVIVVASDRTTQTARTDQRGAFSVSMPAGRGPYDVSASALGYTTQTRRVAGPVAGQTVVEADFRLVPVAQVLAPVVTRAQRQRPVRSDAAGAGPGEAGTTAGLGSSVTGDLSGDLATAMATVPGLLLTPDPLGGMPSISAFGLTPDQNGLTLNGMNFDASSVPRDGLVLRVASSTYDPGRGGFSGVQTSLRLPPGTDFITRSLHFTGDDPRLQQTPASAAQLGSQYSRQIVSGSVSGPIAEDRAFYSTSFQLSRRSSDLVTLTSANSVALQALGVSSDSVSKLLSAVNGVGIPAFTSGIPGARTTTNASFLSRFDLAHNTTSRTGNVFYVLASGRWGGNAGARNTAIGLPSHGGDVTNWGGQLQATASQFLGTTLNETNSSVATSGSRTRAYLAIPDARVRVNSTFADGSAGSTTLQLGGNAGAESDTRSSSVQLRNETSWFSWDNRHQFRITLDTRVDREASTLGTNRLGTFAYNSLDDFLAGRPASFTRTLGDRETSGNQWLGALGIGDIYRPFPVLRLQYGVRLEANRFGSPPAFNAAVDSLFSVRTNHVPNSFTLAPMLGFTRQYRAYGGGNFTGGIREYVGVLGVPGVEAVARQTGLPDAVQQIECVGSATPTPAWNSYRQSSSSVPGQCADGSLGTVLSLSSPPVTAFESGFGASRRWGMSLGWNGRMVQRWTGSVTLNYSVNANRRSVFDLNFDPRARFVLASEANRPVFVSPASVVSATGAVASQESRRYAQFAQVNELKSDLRSETRQVILGINSRGTGLPPGARVSTSYGVYYTFSVNRDQARGFGETTAGDPRAVAWGSSGLPRHTLQALVSLRVPRWVNIDAFSRITAGRSYTPVVSSDINGDGLTNDRAFIFNPSAPPDTQTAAAMASLLRSVGGSARSCLTRQFGRVAARNSCSGPWSQTLNMAISPDPALLGLQGRGSAQLIVTNVFAALDQMLHGSSNLHHWGPGASTDATLLNVRGFDPGSKRFLYSVNPLFGGTTASRAVTRVPFVVALDIRLALGPNRDAQELKAFFKPRPADSTPVLTEAQIRGRLDRDAQNNFQDVVSRRNAIKLTKQQIDSLNLMAKHLESVRDSVYGKLAAYLASVRGRYMAPEVRRRWRESFIAIAHVYVELGPRVRGVLTDEQFESLPISIGAFFAMDEEQFQRLMQTVDFGSLMELITGEGPEGD